MRKIRYNIQPTFWTCPHCGFVHRAADLLRLDSDNLQCRQCKQGFQAVAIPAQARSDRSDDKNSQS
jgi:hypothetical protein